MSTGDQTQYIRGKLAERGISQGVKFMKDGFDLWAESTAPARAGEMEKEPAEETNMEGGRMTLRMAKRFQHRGAAMCGGALPPVVEDGIKFGKQLIDVYKKVSSWIDDFQQDLQDEIIDNPDRTPELKDFALKLKTYLSTMMGYKSIVDEIVKFTGAGKNTGGDLASSIATMTEYAKKIINVIMWFRNNAKNIKAVLSMKSLNVELGLGKQLLSAIEPFLNLVSIGAAKPCACDDGPKPRGRAKPMTTKEIQDSIQKALTKPMEGKVSAHVAKIVEKAKKLEARRAKHTKGSAWYDDVGNVFNPQSYASQMQSVIMPEEIGYATRKDEAEVMPEKMFYNPGRAEGVMVAAGRRKHKRKGGAELYYPPAAGGTRDGEMHSGITPDVARRVGGAYFDDFLTIKANEDARLQQIMSNKAKEDARIQQMLSEQVKKESARLQKVKDEFMTKKVGGLKKLPSARGMIVSKVMRDMKMSLPQASKYVKDHGLF